MTRIGAEGELWLAGLVEEGGTVVVVVAVL